MGDASQLTFFLAFVGVASTLGAAVPLGYCMSVVNNPAVFMRPWCQDMLKQRYDWNLDAFTLDIVWSIVVAIFVVGCTIGSLCGAVAANKLGRRGAFFLSGALYVIGALLFMTCRVMNSVEFLVIGRIVSGLAAGITTASLPMYHSEIAPLALRGAFGVLCVIGLTIGVFTGQIISLYFLLGSEELWHVALSFYAVLTIVCYAPLCYYPESPTWLYTVKGDKENTIKQLIRLRGNVGMDVIEQEFAVIEAEAKANAEIRGFREVLADKKLFLPLVYLCTTMAARTLSGVNSVIYYSVSTFVKAGFSLENAQYVNVGYGTFKIAVALFSPVLMTKLNRRILMLISSIFCGLPMTLFAFVMHWVKSVSWFKVVLVVCIFTYVVSFEIGMGPIPFFLGAELFEATNRPVAMSMGGAFFWGFNFLMNAAFPTLENLIGSFTFLIFGFTCAVVFVFTYFYLPETRGKLPSEVAPLMADGFKSRVR